MKEGDRAAQIPIQDVYLSRKVNSGLEGACAQTKLNRKRRQFRQRVWGGIGKKGLERPVVFLGRCEWGPFGAPSWEARAG